MSVIICEERPTCRDQNVNRWYCHADAQGDCPVARCAVTQQPGDPSPSGPAPQLERGINAPSRDHNEQEQR